MPIRAGPDSAAIVPYRAAAALDWRRWRLPLALIAFIVLGGIVIAVISRLIPPPPPNSYLDPASNAPDGSHALADILAERGFTVVGTHSTSRALAALGTPGPGRASAGSATTGPGPPVRATLVITSPALLTQRERAGLQRAKADLLLIEPGRAALADLAPGVLVQARSGSRYGALLMPRCTLAAARLAGPANIGGSTYHAAAPAARCYPSSGFPSLVRYTAAGRTITILGSGAALTNSQLADSGNAALLLNLLSGHRRIVWLTPEPPGQVTAVSPGRGGRSGPDLIPWPAWLVVIQLGIAALFIAGWRARRLGPLITERLPVVVRASETVEGHARLYQSRRARARAAGALREAMLGRVLPVLGLARAASADTVTSALARRSRLGQQEISAVVYGHAPATDAELVSLVRSLDELEREVRAQ